MTGRFSLVVSFKCLGARTVTAFSALQFIITIIYSVLFIFFCFPRHRFGYFGVEMMADKNKGAAIKSKRNKYQIL